MYRTDVVGTSSSDFSGCGDPTIETDERGVPRERGFWPSLVEERQANADGTFLSSADARRRVDEFDVSSDDLSRWPVDTITYKRFRDPAVRSTYLRRALGRYALIEAKERGLGTSLERVRKVAGITSSSTAAEWWSRSVHGADLLPGQRGRSVSLPETVHSTIKNSRTRSAPSAICPQSADGYRRGQRPFRPRIFRRGQHITRERACDEPGNFRRRRARHHQRG